MRNPNILRNITDNAGMRITSLALISSLALTGCSLLESEDATAQPVLATAGEVELIADQVATPNMVETTTTLPEPDFVESLPPDVRKETLELWLKGSEVSSFCAESVELMVNKSDLQSTFLDQRVAISGPLIADKTISQQDSLVPVNLCLDPKSFVFDDKEISANMTTNPEIHNEGGEGQPDLFMTLREDGTVGYCVEAREEMKDLLQEQIAEIGKTLQIKTGYDIKVRVNPGLDYPDSITHPCDDIATP